MNFIVNHLIPGFLFNKRLPGFYRKLKDTGILFLLVEYDTIKTDTIKYYLSLTSTALKLSNQKKQKKQFKIKYTANKISIQFYFFLQRCGIKFGNKVLIVWLCFMAYQPLWII